MNIPIELEGVAGALNDRKIKWKVKGEGLSVKYNIKHKIGITCEISIAYADMPDNIHLLENHTVFCILADFYEQYYESQVHAAIAVEEVIKSNNGYQEDEDE